MPGQHSRINKINNLRFIKAPSAHRRSHLAGSAGVSPRVSGAEVAPAA